MWSDPKFAKFNSIFCICKQQDMRNKLAWIFHLPSQLNNSWCHSPLTPIVMCICRVWTHLSTLIRAYLNTFGLFFVIRLTVTTTTCTCFLDCLFSLASPSNRAHFSLLCLESWLACITSCEQQFQNDCLENEWLASAGVATTKATL